MAETWNTNHLLKGKRPAQLESEIKRDVARFKFFRGKLNKNTSTGTFQKAVVLFEKIRVSSLTLESFFYLKFCENTKDPAALAKLSYLNQVLTALENEMKFFSLWFMKLDSKSALRLMDAKELFGHKYYFVLLRKLKDYTKSEEIERIIALKSITGAGAFSSLYDIITGGFTYDINGQKGLAQDQLLRYFESPKPTLREKAYKKLLSKYEENSTVLNEIYKNIVLDWYNESMLIRGYASPISVRNRGNDIDDEIIDVLLRVIRNNAKIFSDYFELKYLINTKKEKKYQFSRYHLYAPSDFGKEAKYDYKKSKKLVLDTYRHFDERFYKAAKEIFDRKHVHSHPKKNKKTGAFCFSIHNEETPFVLLNHSDTLQDLFTMMHELGHGIHGVFARKQTNLLYDPSLAMAETASVFGEKILSSRMLEESKNKAEKKKILVHLLDRQYATIMRQAYFVYFEQFAHEKIKNGVTKEELDEHYISLLREHLGKMDIPDLFRHEWNYLPHIHNAPFYCYAYAFGNLLVLSLYALYKKQGKKFVDKYVEILSCGGGKSPAELIKLVGFDPSSEKFWQAGFDIIKEEIEELRRLA